METLLSLTSKRAGEWFKEELRVLGGVDHIVRTIRDCVTRLQRAHANPAAVWDSDTVDTLRKADRCIRVLENVTQQNEENQLYLVTERTEPTRCDVAATLAALLSLCCEAARLAPPPHVHTALLDAALPAIKVLINLSHNFTPTSTLGATMVGRNVSVMEDCLLLLHNEAGFVPENKNFEFCVCVLLLLINLVQNNESNVRRLLEVTVPTRSAAASVSALTLLMQHFYMRQELATLAEKNTDDILDGDDKEKVAAEKKKQTSQDEVEETVSKLLAKAGAHMEHSMVGAYIVLLLGHAAALSPRLDESGAHMEHSMVGAYIVLLLGHAAALSPRLDESVRAHSRTGDYAPLLAVLRKYAAFVDLTASAEAASVAHIKSTKKVIEFLEESDKRHSEAGTTPTQDPRYIPNPYLHHQAAPVSPSDLPQDMSLSNLSGSDNSYN